MTARHENSIAAVTPALLADVLRRFGRVRLRATGNSMLPTIGSGDILLVVDCSVAHTEPGDVVVFSAQARIFAHRLIDKCVDPDGSFMVTRGDSNWQMDPKVSASQLLGKVVAVGRRGQRSSAPSRCSRFGRARGIVASEWIRAVGRARALLHRKHQVAPTGVGP
jgi:signal peptidase I